MPKPQSHSWITTYQRTAWLILWCSLLGGAGFWLWQHYLANPAHFPLNSVRITGQFTHLNQAPIERELSKHIVGSGFFSVDLRRLHQQVIALPWVAEASIRRVWPDALDIQITEQVPVARWQTTKPAHWVNAAGELFRPDHQLSLKLPVLFGAAEHVPAMMALYQQIQPAIAGLGLSLQQLHLNALGEWQFQFQQGLTLMLGRRQPLQRWRDFTHIYPQLSGELRRIDMRYEQGFALQRAQETN